MSDGVPNTHMGENSRAIIRPAYHRERRRRRTEDEALPRTVSRPQRYMRYIINDLRRRPLFPLHMGCPARAPRPPLFRQTRQLSGCFRPPMRRLRAKMDVIAHTRDNPPSVRRMPSIQAFGPAGALWPLPNPRLEHRPQLVRNLAFFSTAGKADALRFSMRNKSFPDERGL